MILECQVNVDTILSNWWCLTSGIDTLAVTSCKAELRISIEIGFVNNGKQVSSINRDTSTRENFGFAN